MKLPGVWLVFRGVSRPGFCAREGRVTTVRFPGGTTVEAVGIRETGRAGRGDGRLRGGRGFRVVGLGGATRKAW